MTQTTAIVKMLGGEKALGRKVSSAGEWIPLLRSGLGYESLSRDNPGLVYTSITGFGRSGPMAGLPAYEGVVADGGVTFPKKLPSELSRP